MKWGVQAGEGHRQHQQGHKGDGCACIDGHVVNHNKGFETVEVKVRALWEFV